MTDPDREGEAISWHVIEIIPKTLLRKAYFKVVRATTTEITKNAVVKSVENSINNNIKINMDIV